MLVAPLSPFFSRLAALSVLAYEKRQSQPPKRERRRIMNATPTSCPCCGAPLSSGRSSRVAPPVTVILEPEGKTVLLPKARTARQVLAALDRRPLTALVIRDGELLTPDRAVAAGDTVRVRAVMSAG